VVARPSVIPTCNFFDPLTTLEIYSDAPVADGAYSELLTQQQTEPSAKRDRKITSHYPNRFDQPIEISRGIKTLSEICIRFPNHQEWNKGSYKGHGRLLTPNALPRRSLRYPVILLIPNR
jgi:hypothetical protein